MNPLQNIKYVNMIADLTESTTSFTTTEVDAKGWDYAVVVVGIGVTTVAITACQVTQSDTTGSGHAAITGCVVGTSTDIDGATSVLPSGTDDGKIWVFEIDLRDKKRYIDLTLTAGAATTEAWALCMLYRADAAPLTGALRGAAHILRA